ncbi:MAG: calcium/proton exchanger [Planctomycetota bacterium]|nr:MAG: calcium/proton exchanger [Planctomycetota bacterium]
MAVGRFRRTCGLGGGASPPPRQLTRPVARRSGTSTVSGRFFRRSYPTTTNVGRTPCSNAVFRPGRTAQIGYANKRSRTSASLRHSARGRSVRSWIASLPKPSWLVLLLPLVVACDVADAPPLAVFVLAAIVVLGTVTLIGKATEEIAAYAGPLWGGLLNATFGNVTELIIALFALRRGLEQVVLASVTGSVLGNLLLVLGAAMVYGGLKHSRQTFSRTDAHANVGMLWVALTIIAVPSLLRIALQLDPQLEASQLQWLGRRISLAGAVLLLVVYVAGLCFSMKTHRFLFMPDSLEATHRAHWSLRTAVAVLFASTCCVAYLSETFVGALETLLHGGGLAMSELFVGVIVVAVVGNAAEGMVAVFVAGKNKMELSFQIAMGSCLQVALLLVPVLVLFSYPLGRPLVLRFNPFELMSLAAAVLIASSALSDGESNWIEGLMMLAVYAFFAAVFWFHP